MRYKVGDRVFIRDYESIKSEFGNTPRNIEYDKEHHAIYIEDQCIWALKEFDDFRGVLFEIKSVGAVYYVLKRCDGKEERKLKEWCFTDSLLCDASSHRDREYTESKLSELM